MNIIDVLGLTFIVTAVTTGNGCRGQDLIGPDPEVAVLIGDNHMLTCSRVEGGQKGQIAWYEAISGGPPHLIFFGSMKVSFAAKYDNFYIESDNVDRFDIVISNITIEDEGTYYCQHVDTNESKFARRTVEVPSSLLRMTQDGSDVATVTVIEDVTSDVVCTALGSRPVVKIQWYHQKDGGSKVVIDTCVSQVNTSNGDGTFNTVSTLQYTATNNFNGGNLRCETTGQDAAQGREDSATLNIQYAPYVTVQYGYDTVICFSDANPITFLYLIIVNDTQIYIPTCSDGMCTLPLAVMTDTHVRCNATNAIGTGTAFTTAVPGAVMSTTPASSTYIGTQQKTSLPDSGLPIVAIAVPLALIAVASIVIAIVILLWKKRHTRQADKDQIDSKRQNSPQPGTATGPNAPQLYMELDSLTREKEQPYEEPQPRTHDAQSPTYEDIDQDKDSKDRVYHEIGDNSKKDEQLPDYVNVQPKTKAKQGRRK